MERGTLAKGTGVSSLLFGVYTILLALLGLHWPIREARWSMPVARRTTR